MSKLIALFLPKLCLLSEFSSNRSHEKTKDLWQISGETVARLHQIKVKKRAANEATLDIVYRLGVRPKGAPWLPWPHSCQYWRLSPLSARYRPVHSTGNAS